MPKWMRLLIALGVAAVLCGVFLSFFGLQTYLALLARYQARQMPFARNTPVKLVDLSASHSIGRKLSYFGFEFEVPWDDIDQAKSRVVGGDKAIIAFHSGNVLMVWRGSPHELADTALKRTEIDPATFRKLYGDEALASDYNFQRIMLEATPDAITPFVSKQKAISQEILFILKCMSAPRGADSGTFLVSAGDFTGFQFGRPSKALNGFDVELYSATDSLDLIFAPKPNGPVPMSQADVNRILQTLHKIPAERAANVTPAG